MLAVVELMDQDLHPRRRRVEKKSAPTSTSFQDGLFAAYARQRGALRLVQLTTPRMVSPGGKKLAHGRKPDQVFLGLNIGDIQRRRWKRRHRRLPR